MFNEMNSGRVSNIDPVSPAVVPLPWEHCIHIYIYIYIVFFHTNLNSMLRRAYKFTFRPSIFPRFIRDTAYNVGPTWSRMVGREARHASAEIDHQLRTWCGGERAWFYVENIYIYKRVKHKAKVKSWCVTVARKKNTMVEGICELLHQNVGIVPCFPRTSM